jgi:tRNA pseudouridine13 synthase
VLARRVSDGVWNRLLPGDVANLDGRRSFFRVDDVDATLAARCAALDVHPSGPLHGRGESPADREAAAIEQAVLGAEASLAALLETEGLAQERRSLRVAVRSLAWQLRPGEIELVFELPRGAFATAVLHELLADTWGVSADSEA